jgi:glyceraldehyde-3-phosphate dehydrogenase/erythrose-4-phosphate dehydrogenase
MYRIYIRGVGVIGWSITSLLLELKKIVSDLEIIIDPYILNDDNLFQIKSLLLKGAKIILNPQNQVDKYNEILEYAISEEEVKKTTLAVLDCSPPQIAENRISEYNETNYPVSQIFLAQGSEHKFGKQIIFPESRTIIESNEKYFHISTCNTHTLVAIQRVLETNSTIEDLDLVIIRRDADMAKNDPHVTGPLFQIPVHENGTHHSRLLNEFYSTLNKKYNVTSSAITVNSPYMHCTRFVAKMSKDLTKQSILESIKNDMYSSYTNKISTNSIFSSGRDRGLNGRIYSQGVWVLPCLEVDKKIVRGIVATPGDSNVVLSSIYTLLLKLNYPKLDDCIAFLNQMIIKEL